MVIYSQMPIYETCPHCPFIKLLKEILLCLRILWPLGENLHRGWVYGSMDVSKPVPVGFVPQLEAFLLRMLIDLQPIHHLNRRFYIKKTVLPFATHPT